MNPMSNSDARKRLNERANTAPTETVSVVHECPVADTAVTPCCGMTPFEIPVTDRLSMKPEQVTCPTRAQVLADAEAEWLAWCAAYIAGEREPVTDDHGVFIAGYLAGKGIDHE